MEGPRLRELVVQALSSVEHGYDLLAPKFDATSFRTPDWLLAATITALREYGPFERGLDVCTGTGAGLEVLAETTAERPTGVDFSMGMLEQAREAHPEADLVRADARALPFEAAYDLVVSFGALGHFLPGERLALFAGIHRALRPGGTFALPAGQGPRPTHPAYWMLTGFDLAMRVRNAVWRPKFVMYYRTHPRPALLRDLTEVGFVVATTPMPGVGELIVARRNQLSPGAGSSQAAERR
ncbi:class I SAM-dependent methyltransferase [Nocardioides albus]|uniref:Ubiquinone/menaquinone biosynthesis C-methylase UbiE n=1 Tax=Nocardioides albus TaxID=1841 RepID=A0A7W5F9J2_9ACTN|nr:class I SAM-dependent methyltransferase [Nocardioides albus]MBB3090369.1 ubiquinone/menaquinone biosynthesis C-methylase UbiE [Nocardioides albus]GGU43182.1 methyltransferase [Nocardioides albus]